MRLDKDAAKLYESLVELVKDITSEEELSPSVLRKLLEISVACSGTTKAPLELIPYDVINQVLKEDYSASGHYYIPVSISNGGELTDTDLSIKFDTKNACPYFNRKNELCGLDGRICLYDTNTFMVCPRYEEGFNRKVAGYDGKVPDIAPQQAVDRPAAKNDGQNDPFNSPLSKL